ncbi:uncharacterized protein Tco025E_06106 [Trypanosoma conorhini]|uniref:Uncharacterized protein n=1 Tax=Trypanosoma conorhini TaxID=83891 RepID=A0A3R7LH14_9TRYP|nr:uncharacterized protein Tco025E_06106 [Trypanosoma conorhini]RNF14262.1 hypothetical protein Tco025E_06106 [Trypanosoma conorhini]
MAPCVRVLVFITSVAFLACSCVLCVVPLFRHNDGDVHAVQTLWLREYEVGSQKFTEYVRDSECGSFNTAFQLMEGAAVASVGLGVGLTLLSGLQLVRPGGWETRMPFLVLVVASFISMLIDFVLSLQAWENGFCQNAPQVSQMVNAYKKNNWTQVEGFVLVCVNFSMSVILFFMLFGT